MMSIEDIRDFVADTIGGDPREDVDFETVPDAWACPACGENRMDRLANRDGRITCACGREYYIG